MRIRPRPIDFNLAKEGITQSLLGAWVKCRVMARYLFQGWEFPLVKEAPAFGSLFHKLLEQAYEAIRLQRDFPRFDVLAEQWQKDNAGRIGNQQMCEVMLAKAEAVWYPYWDFWQSDIDEKTWVATESRFRVRWHGYLLRGMRDGIFHTRKGTPMLLESKTKGRIDPRGILRMLPMDWQNLFYITASRAEGIDVRHVLYNVIRRPALRQGKSETLPAFAQRMRTAVEKDPEKYFLRYESSYSEKVLKEFGVELRQKLTEFRLWLENPTFTYRNQSACMGLWNCEFLEACSSGTMEGYTCSRRLFRELE